jgi:hypothetical protein
MIDIVTRYKLSKLIKNPALTLPVIKAGMETSRPLVVKQYLREIPRLSGLAASKVHASSVWAIRDDIYYDVTTIATNNGFRYPLAVAGGTGRFKGSEKDYPSFGRVKNGETNKGAGGIKPNKFATRAAIGSRMYVVKHMLMHFTQEMNKMVESTNG